MINIKILNYDDGDDKNYINIKKRVLIINNHKNYTKKKQELKKYYYIKKRLNISKTD